MSDQKSNRSVKKWFTIRPWLLVSLATCLLVAVNFNQLLYFSSNLFVPYVPQRLPKADLLPLTSNLPTLDRIEIESVQADSETVGKVLAKKTLVGSETNEFANLWRAQNYMYEVEVACHEPGYRVRFYEHGALLTEATVCFHCTNIYFYKYPGATGYKDMAEVVFGTFNPKHNDPAFNKLRTYLSDLFPGHDPDAAKP